eukprot:s1_g2534.t1
MRLGQLLFELGQVGLGVDIGEGALERHGVYFDDLRRLLFQCIVERHVSACDQKLLDFCACADRPEGAPCLPMTVDIQQGGAVRPVLGKKVDEVFWQQGHVTGSGDQPGHIGKTLGPCKTREQSG